MSESPKIVTLTINPCLDISAEVDRVVPTKKLRCRNDRKDPGGGGINVSRAIAILGGESTAVYPTGGSTGEALKGLLDGEGIDSSTIPMDQANRESFAVRETDGDQYRFALPGPQLDEQTWQRCLEEVKGIRPEPHFVVASGSLPPGVPDDFYGYLTGQFSESYTKVVLDTSGDPLKTALDQPVYLIKPNQRELEYVCDCSLDDEEAQEEASREMIRQGRCEVLVLTLGARGALLTSADEQLRIPGLEVEQVSAVGAGDSFVGSMVLALARGMSLREAFFYGMAAGTAALLTEATELCRREDTQTFFDKLQRKYGQS